MRVLIADPQSSVRHALSVWISSQLGWDIVGESSNAFDLLEKLNRVKPRLIILDKELPGLSIKELVTRIRQWQKMVAIILLYNETLDDIQVNELGVDFVASKVDPPARMLETLLKARIWVESKRKS